MISGMARQVASPVLVGRRAELEALDEALEATAAGRPTLVTVSGEAGVGKTRLLEELARRGGERGFTVISGACLNMGEGVVPLAPVAEALQDMRAHLGDGATRSLLGESLPTLAPLLPGLGERSAVPPQRSALLEHLRVLVERLAERAPVGLIVEDLHWSDPSSRDVLAYIARRVRSRPVLMAWSYRADELHRRHPLVPFLAEIERSARPVRLDLEPLSEPDVGELVAAVRGAPGSAEEVARLFARSGGNPFFLEELLCVDGGAGPLPTGLRAVLSARLATLPAEARDLVRAAAVIGAADIDEGLLLELAGLQPDEARRGLRLLVEAYVLRPSGGGYSFRHALLQEAAYDDLLPGERIAMHEGAARAMERLPAGGSAARRALHWSEARDLANALGASVEAGVDALRVGAAAEAVTHLERAIELWDRVPDAAERSSLPRPVLLDRAAQANAQLRQFDRARALHEQAIEAVDEEREPVAAALLHEQLGYTLCTSGQADPLPAYRRALALVPASPPSAERAQVLAGMAVAMMLLWHDEAAEIAREAISAAVAAGDRRLEGHARCTLGATLASLGKLDEALPELVLARALAEAHGTADDVARAWTNQTHAWAVGCAWAELATQGLDGVHWAQQTGRPCSGGVGVAVNVSEGLYALGRWDEARALHDQLGERVLGTQLSHFALHPIWCESGRFDRARDILAGSDPPANADVAAQHDLPAATMLASIALWHGRPEEARELGAGTLARLAENPPALLLAEGWPLIWRAFWAEADLARSAGGAFDPAGIERLRTLFRQAGFGEARGMPPICAPYVALCEAEAARALDEGAVEPWRHAVEVAAGVGLAYESAYARTRLAQALISTESDREEAAELLRDARQAAIRMDARPLRELVELTARLARIRLDDAEGRREPDAPFGLTRREREVLALLADGLSNGQIADRLVISRKTASVHVSNILAKLDVRTRGEAAARVHREGLTERG